MRCALWPADDDLQSLRSWRKAGVGDRMMDAITKAYDGNVKMIDTSVVRVHQKGPAGKRGGEIVVSVARASGLPPRSTPSSMRKGARSSSATAGQARNIAGAADLTGHLAPGAALMADKS